MAGGNACYPKKYDLTCANSYGISAYVCDTDCVDKAGKWRKKKCKKKLKKNRNKCRKKKVAKKCAASCELCGQ